MTAEPRGQFLTRTRKLDEVRVQEHTESLDAEDFVTAPPSAGVSGEAATVFKISKCLFPTIVHIVSIYCLMWRNI